MDLLGLERFNEHELQIIKTSYDIAENLHSGVKRLSGEDYFEHPKAVAQILIDGGKDYITVSACLLHDLLEDTKITKEELTRLLNCEEAKKIVYIVDGVTKTKKSSSSSKKDLSLATTRKLFKSFFSDIRVIEVKLADRLHNMRTAEYWSEQTRKRKIKETKAIYIPVAERIGAYRIKNELEDLCFYYEDNAMYKVLEEETKILKEDCQAEVLEMKQKIGEMLTHQNIPYEMEFRIKTLYALYRDLKKFNKTKIEPNDLRSLKILLEKINDCYLALGIVDRLYPSREIKSFIGNPKPNAYESIHDIVTTPKGKTILVKIRTYGMDNIDAYGMDYETFRKKGGRDMFQSWVMLNNSEPDNKEFYKQVKDDISKSQVLFFDRSGKWRALRVGSTVVDFAYDLHTQIGVSMIGAVVNGVAVDLNYQIKDGDVVEIITNKEKVFPTNEDIQYARTFYAQENIRRERKRVNSLTMRD